MTNTALKNTYVKKRFSDVARIVTGKTPATSNRLFFGGHIPFVTPGDLDGEDPIVTTKTQLTVEGADEVNQLPEGSVLVSCIGSLGKIGIAGVNVCTNQQINALVFDKTLVEPRYGYHFCKTLRPYLEGIAPATTLPIINKSRFSEIEMPLPPLPEQRRIALILDKADALRAKRRETIAKLDHLLRSVFLEMFGDPVTNSKGWPQVRFSELLDSIDSGTSPVCLDRSAVGREWGVLKLSAVTRCEYDPSANKALPEGLAPNESLEVKAGDLLFTRKNTRDLVAACAYVTNTPPRLLLPDLIFRFRLKKRAPVMPRYLQALLSFPGKRKDIQSLAGGSAGSMPNISKAKLSNALIELPPTDLQCEFERRLRQCDLLKEKQHLALAKLDATFFALQQQAFMECCKP